MKESPKVIAEQMKQRQVESGIVYGKGGEGETK